MMPLGQADLQRRAAQGDPEAIQTLEMLQGQQGGGGGMPTQGAPQGGPPPLPGGQQYMGPAGGGVVPPGMPQGMPQNPGAVQMLLQKLRGG